MRIHQIINYLGRDRGGAERLAVGLHLDLCAVGVAAHIVSLEGAAVDGLERAECFGLGSSYDPRALAKLRRYVAAHVRAGDLVHAHLFPASAHVAVLKRLGVIRGPCLFTEHSTFNGRRGRRFLHEVDRAVYGAYDRIVAVSEGVKASLLAAYPGLHGRTTVIANGCELRFTSPPVRAASGCPTILSIGRLTRPKNYGAALEALAKLGKRPFRYVVVGEGEDRAALEARAADLGLRDRVTFEGFKSDVVPYVLAADLLLMPSLWEGFGLAVAEAMNAALPVVASNVPGLAEVVGPTGECGLLADPMDPGSIAAAIVALLDAPEHRIEMGRRGFLRAQQFGKDRMTEAYIVEYQDVLRRGTHAAA